MRKPREHPGALPVTDRQLVSPGLTRQDDSHSEPERLRHRSRILHGVRKRLRDRADDRAVELIDGKAGVIAGPGHEASPGQAGVPRSVVERLVAH